MTVHIVITAKLLFHQAWIPMPRLLAKACCAASVDTCIGYLVLRSSLGLKKRNGLIEPCQLALSFTFTLAPMRNAAVGTS